MIPESDGGFRSQLPILGLVFNHKRISKYSLNLPDFDLFYTKDINKGNITAIMIFTWSLHPLLNFAACLSAALHGSHAGETGRSQARGA
jgi:hypothetical protein